MRYAVDNGVLMQLFVDPSVSLCKTQVTGSWMIRGVSASRGTGCQGRRSVAEPVLRRMKHMLCAFDRKRVSRVFLVQDLCYCGSMKRILVNFLNSPFGAAKGKEDKGSGNMNRGVVGGTLHFMRCPARCRQKVTVPVTDRGDWELE